MGDFPSDWDQLGPVDQFGASFDELMLQIERNSPEFFLSSDLDLGPDLLWTPSYSTDLGNALTGPTAEVPTTLERSLSKRSRRDSARSDDEATEQKSKRNKKIKDGFSCNEHGCTKCFDRACDLSKHHRRVHTAKNERPHECPECGGKFCWPKDVRRHLWQVHRIDHSSSKNETAVGFPDPQIKVEEVTGPLVKPIITNFPTIKSTSSPTSPKSPKSPSMAWLAQSLVMLKKLRIRAKSIDESDADDKYIFVTLDKRDFRMVDLAGATTEESLSRKIAATFNLQLSGQSSNLLLHRFRHGSRLGEQLSGERLMATIRKAIRAKRTLKLFLTPQASQPPPPYTGGLS